MSKRVILVLAFCVVAALSFYAGTYYAKHSVSSPSQAASSETLLGVLMAHEYASVTIGLENGTSRKIPIDRNTKVSLVSSAASQKLSDLTIGDMLRVVTSNGFAQSIQILSSAAATSTQPVPQP